MLHISDIIPTSFACDKLRPPRQSSGRWAGRLPPLELHPMPMDDGLSHMVAGRGRLMLTVSSWGHLRFTLSEPMLLGCFKKRGQRMEQGQCVAWCRDWAHENDAAPLMIWLPRGIAVRQNPALWGGCLSHFSFLVAIPSGCKMVSINYLLPW